MKNKRLLYVLLPAVLTIWGLIFQRIWSAAGNSPEPEMEIVSPRFVNRPVASHQPPKLLLDYSDPFKIGTINTPRAMGLAGPSSNAFQQMSTSTSPILNFPAAASPVPVLPVVWPSLRYLGSIDNNRQNTRIALLAIEEKEAMLKIGENRLGIVLTKIFRDSVRVIFQGKNKTIIRNVPAQ